MKSFLLCAVATSLFVVSPAIASTASPGNPTSLLALNDGPILFNQDGSRTSAPSCATVAGRWAMDARTPAGQSRLSVLLTAVALHKQIEVQGTGTCSVWPDTETVDYIHIAD
ncbi:hypothetical protein [Sphingomonas sp. PAMC 26605]|uniref:hypothetical protein n=1 Tax=Sphingomonas sp. PAMC 26605 TaxID=1112214 RepID=UPI0012F48D8C|nr:hypothetical protein [Sphingomonas sp. PAMC 26605]